MAAQSSLDNEERNLLRIREQERRNQEAQQERENFNEHAPLFPEPYKRRKGDELSCRIEKMLGCYDETKELIDAKTNTQIHNISKSSVVVSSHQKPDCRKVEPRIPSINSSSGHHHRPRTTNKLIYGHVTKSYSTVRGNSQDLIAGEQQRKSKPMDINSKRSEEDGCAELSSSPSSISALSPLLSSLSSPVEPLSPLHSSHQIDSKLRAGQMLEKTQSNNILTSPVLNDIGSRDGLAPVTNLVTSSQSFPSSLPSSKANAMPQKPTAYVRPMDGQDQMPCQSPYIKDDEESYGNLADEKISKMEISSETLDPFSNEAHCVEEILKEMTHSWPPPISAIPTPSTAEPSKFRFHIKESQHVPSVKGSQKQYDYGTSSKLLPSSQQEKSMLEKDLQLSDSEDSDEVEDREKPRSFSAPPSILQSQTDTVFSAHSSSVESESSATDSTSDTESEDSSSDSEVNEHPKAPTPEPDPDIWQLRHYLNKVGPSTAPNENNNNVDHEQPSHWDSKGQGSLSPSPYESPKTLEPPIEKSPWTSQEEIQNKEPCIVSPKVNETVTARQTAGIKHPRKSLKLLVPEEPKFGLKVESEPAPYRPRDQPSKEKPSVKTKEKAKSSECKEPKAIISQHAEKKKHRSSHHGSSEKKCSSSILEKSRLSHSLPQCPSSVQVQSQSKANHRTNITHPAVVVREDLHRDKVLLPIGDNRLPPLSINHKTHSLVVKIELSLLSKVPCVAGKPSHLKSKKENSQHTASIKKIEPEKKLSQNHHKEHTKRKVEEGEKNVMHKKIKLETEAKSTSHKQLLTKRTPKESSENFHKKHYQEKPTSHAEHTDKKTEKLPQKRRSSESSPCRQLSTASSSKNTHKEPSSKHRKMEEKPSDHVKSSKGSKENNTNPFPVPSLPNGSVKPTRPQLKFEDGLHSPEHYMKEAKKLKHKADAMSDKIGKSFSYLDAAMFFIECGIAMESDVQAPKPAYTIIAETVDLIKFILKLKNFADSTAPAHEISFAVLCMRCQSVLYMAMFRYKKDTAIKYSRTLGEHFKNSSRAAQAPSPCIARSTGTPSPLSPTPSPASSVGSQPASIASSSGTSSSSIAIPQMIHHIASSYVNITSYVLYAYDIWEQADLLAKNNKGI
ncbi:hypothetical protein GDO86_000839 [Hymenochirus boettgeri]|uniref:AF4/FMR2 C-terminal homology domain-containing protein n=1 Tax=Hymenochirus boettgeri TaxID=247094 RepID=A0A8T2KDH8_9PIPI|nr:hypothetical protein GDO86_000839 [Hymenochirus boettgeri]